MASSRLSRRTVRMRLTLLYGGLFLASGVLLLGITYLLTRHAVYAEPPGLRIRSVAPGEAPVPDEPAPPGAGRIDLKVIEERAAQAMAEQRAAVVRQLLVQSGVALGIMLVVSLGLGWMVAGRVLGRLRTITGAAREISATDLHRRLAIAGPADELKELGDTFDGLLGRLETSFQTQRQFVANASHELRTPLARQRVIGQVALADPDASAKSLRAAHERILAAGAQQERLIEALLLLTRSQAGIEARGPVDLAELAREAVDTRGADAASAGVTIRLSAAPAVAGGHRPLADRLVANLVDNAIRHNTSGGWVEVQTRTVDGAAVLTVTNSGPWIEPDDVERLFEPFQRAGARTGGGLGLGLSIVAAIATAHGATRTATARPDGGLSITVAFP
jgi:signal transduction histidine kinase